MFQLRRICPLFVFLLNSEAVMAVCDIKWISEGKTLTVIPYFDCFQEPFEEQCHRLQQVKYNPKSIESEVESTLQHSEVLFTNDSGLVSIQDNEPNNIISRIDNLTLQDTSLQDTEEEIAKDSDTTTTVIYYEERIIPLIINKLNFEKVLQQTNLLSSVQISETDITIVGSAPFLKKIWRPLLQKNFQVQLSY